ncbi:MAG: nitroreductase family deazaflavin-dependent oxidoreductase, partial [Chloroflexi bacterium]|nr:nitroreductase family deazaflavin-dependent oxidoreductase [Chloroflexota bacterium]
MFILKRPPRGILRVFARMPLWLYRARLGWLLGRRFLMLRHTGRATRRPREVLLEVVHHDRETDRYFVASAWGEKAQWVRNIRANSAVGLVVGRRRVEARAQR